MNKKSQPQNNKNIEDVKEDFIYLLSHKLNTPLTSVKWTLELLEDEDFGKLSKKQKDFIGQALTVNQKMVDFIDDLKDISRIERGYKFAIHKYKTDIVSIIDKVINRVSLFTESRDISIIKDKKFPKKLKLSVDGEKIEKAVFHVFLDIIDNIKDDSKININLKKNKSEVLLSIKHKRPYIPKKDWHTIFKKFNFYKNQHFYEKSATGMGLYIAKYIVEEHGGQIWFESVKNKKSTFFIKLPLK